MDISDLPATAFGAGEDMEERLAALIVAGRKRATVCDGRLDAETRPGMLWRVTARGRDIAVIETLSLEHVVFTWKHNQHW